MVWYGPAWQAVTDRDRLSYSMRRVYLKTVCYKRQCHGGCVRAVESIYLIVMTSLSVSPAQRRPERHSVESAIKMHDDDGGK